MNNISKVIVMAYPEFIINYIKHQKIGEPIYSAKIAEQLANNFNIELTKANLAVAVVLKRLLAKNNKLNLRFYQNGIYYLTKRTSFGDFNINNEALIFNKYLANNKGYETGLNFMYRLGLTTQIPRNREFVTNVARNGTRYDKKLDVRIRPPKTKINDKNILYFQLLDIVDCFNKAPLDVNNPYKIIADYIVKKRLAYNVLLAYADEYYGKSAILNLAHIAKEGGLYYETT